MAGSVFGRRPSAVLDMGAEIGDLDKEGAYASDSPAMILTCPECATRYFVDDARIGAKGREVRCASCGHRWSASRQNDPLLLDPAAAADKAPPAATSAESAMPAHELPADELPADVLPKVYRQRAQTKAKEREAAATGAVWAALAGGFVVLIAATVLLRQDIAQIWPRTAGAYAMAGLPVNLVGLTIEGQRAQPMLKDGHADLAVSGTLRNIRGKPVAAPPLKISLLAADGRVVATQIARPADALVPAGETRRFVIDMLDPPISAANVEIAFVFQGRIPKGKATASSAAPTVAGSTPPTAIDLRGAAAPAAEEAKPVPSSSPYALPATATPSSPHG
jgi:predicted Zn finger-like uncharacterized protein